MVEVSLSRSILAYCCLSCGFSMLSSSFYFYYVKVFLNFYHVDESWFQFAQALFLVWNAVNDPLFAYWQDTHQSLVTRTRRASVLYSAPVMALSYLLPWFQWGTSSWVIGLHLITALCCFDAAFTFCGLAACALFTEISSDQAVRLKITRYSQIANLIGHSAVFFCEFTSKSLQNFQAFQMTTAVIALCSWLLMNFTGHNAHTEYDRKKLSGGVSDTLETNVIHDKKFDSSLWQLTKQILSDRNFLSFVGMNFCQEFHRAFLGQFTSIICDQLVTTDRVPVTVRSSFYGFISMFPQLLVIFGAPVVGHFGYFNVIRWNFFWKIGGGLVLYLVGAGNPWLLMIFLLLDAGFTSGAFSLFNMPLADIADWNKEINNHKHPISSMIFGTNALVVKPALSLSPMLIVAILNRYGYSQLKEEKLFGSDLDLLHSAMFHLVCFYPVVIGIIQLAVWSFYRTRLRTTPTVEA